MGLIKKVTLIFGAALMGFSGMALNASAAVYNCKLVIHEEVPVFTLQLRAKEGAIGDQQNGIPDGYVELSRTAYNTNLFDGDYSKLDLDFYSFALDETDPLLYSKEVETILDVRFDTSVCPDRSAEPCEIPYTINGAAPKQPNSGLEFAVKTSDAPGDGSRLSTFFRLSKSAVVLGENEFGQEILGDTAVLVEAHLGKVMLEKKKALRSKTRLQMYSTTFSTAQFYENMPTVFAEFSTRAKYDNNPDGFSVSLGMVLSCQNEMAKTSKSNVPSEIVEAVSR